MTQNFAWTKEEISKLFAMVAEHKKQNKPIMSAFKEFAMRFARKTLSVRNFYYAQVKVFEENQDLCQKWGIDLSFHKKNVPVFFTAEEEKQQMQEIQEMVQRGHSVRHACKTLSGGDIAKMLRLQNKYHALKQKKEDRPSNVFVMPQKKERLSDGEIGSLVLGLVKLVQKTAEEKAEENFQQKIKLANFELRKSIKNLAEKEREVQEVRQKFEILCTEKEALSKEIEALRCQNVELLKNASPCTKMNGLKNYVKKLAQKPALKT